jgi:hypothetical protein
VSHQYLGSQTLPTVPGTSCDNPVVPAELTKTPGLLVTRVSVDPLQMTENMGLF